MTDIATSFFTTLAALALGAYLSIGFFPLHAKRREWKWQKEIWAREYFFERISRIAFLSDHFVRGELSNEYSMAGTQASDMEKEITLCAKEIHANAHKAMLYMQANELEALERYIEEIQAGFNHAKDTWRQWHDDDHLAEEFHTIEFIDLQGKAAKNALNKLTRRRHGH
ncbi:hypothetical protein [Halomonas sp. NO4]|uniref:hypothetical protein n=1 Tax=Halomonas sp. NO4 TaxID=2484813 RepID=UPI0013D06B55|nr:hypothetical protein [Halomonas sp. NO4]